MHIGIIGAGFTGMAAAQKLLAAGHQVTLIESDSQVGGLANSFSVPQWEWPLEKHYHHIFTSDWSIRNLAREIGHPLIFSRPLTSTYTSQGIHQLDSPVSLLRFPLLSVFDRLRTGLGLAYLKIVPFWRPLEKITAKKFITSVMGQTSWKVIWEPLFKGKFQSHASTISAAWIWARVFKRSSSLGYPYGGFDRLSQALASHISNLGGRIMLNSQVTSISSRKHKGRVLVTLKNHRRLQFDKVICTLPTPVFARIASGITQTYRDSLLGLPGLGAVNLVLSIDRKFLPQDIYWLNVNVPHTPFLAVVEHTNFMDSSHYANTRLLYVGNYLPSSHPYFTKTASQLLSIFLPHLKAINSDFQRSWVKRAWVWKAPFAQPLVTRNYSRRLPQMITPLPNVILANIQQVYPWDRGTNYAVELGQKAAQICLRP